MYGTLKRGFAAHERLCGSISGATSASINAKLYDLPEGYPAIVVDGNSVLAHGSVDFGRDLQVQEETTVSGTAGFTGGDRVHGEVLHFPGPEDVAALDAYEGFVPGGGTFYERVLVAAETPDGSVTSWAYAAREVRGRCLPGGKWPDEPESGA